MDPALSLTGIEERQLAMVRDLATQSSARPGEVLNAR